MREVELETTPLLLRLKTETRPHHERIEAAVPLLRPDLSREAYQQHLARLLGFYHPVEQRLGECAQAWAACGLDFSARRKVGWLRADLLALGLRPEQLEALPECTALPMLSGLARAWGCLYVLEGSTLGGQILSRHIGRTLGVTPETGGAFLRGYGEATGPMWRCLGEALSTCAVARVAPAAVVEGAQETFTRLEAWLREGSEAIGATPGGG
jgi:heme oxygenase (biliverdin-IX-beta and delta-forming)